MTRISFFAVTLFLACLIASFPAMAMCGENKMNGAELKQAFISAKTELEKLNLAIKIINCSGLNRYSLLSEFDSAFGTEFYKKRKKLGRGESASAVIRFQPQKSSPRDELAVDYSGWYMVIKYDAGGLVIDYFVTNAHK